MATRFKMQPNVGVYVQNDESDEDSMSKKIMLTMKSAGSNSHHWYFTLFCLGSLLNRPLVESGGFIDAGIQTLLLAFLSMVLGFIAMGVGVGYIWQPQVVYHNALNYCGLNTGGTWVTWITFYPVFIMGCVLNIIIIIAIIYGIIKIVTQDR